MSSTSTKQTHHKLNEQESDKINSLGNDLKDLKLVGHLLLSLLFFGLYIFIIFMAGMTFHL